MNKTQKFGRKILLLALLGMSLSLLVVETASACPPGKVWVAAHRLQDGTLIPGYCRKMVLFGAEWVPGHFTGDGRWVQGDWKPVVNPPKGTVWVPGHTDRMGRWVPGRWRRP